MSRSCWRCTTAAGCARALDKYRQSDGHAISVSRLVPQHTAQMSRLTPGHARFALRTPQSGQTDFMQE